MTHTIEFQNEFLLKLIFLKITSFLIIENNLKPIKAGLMMD